MHRIDQFPVFQIKERDEAEPSFKEMEARVQSCVEWVFSQEEEEERRFTESLRGRSPPSQKRGFLVTFCSRSSGKRGSKDKQRPVVLSLDHLKQKMDVLARRCIKKHLAGSDCTLLADPFSWSSLGCPLLFQKKSASSEKTYELGELVFSCAQEIARRGWETLTPLFKRMQEDYQERRRFEERVISMIVLVVAQHFDKHPCLDTALRGEISPQWDPAEERCRLVHRLAEERRWTVMFYTVGNLTANPNWTLEKGLNQAQGDKRRGFSSKGVGV